MLDTEHQLKQVGRHQHYLLFQDILTKEYFVKAPSDHNHLLRIYPQHLEVIPLTEFLRCGIMSIIRNVLKTAEINSDWTLIFKCPIILQESDCTLFEHTIFYKGYVQLTILKDGVSELLPLKIHCSRDGFFFAIETEAIQTETGTFYFSDRNRISTANCNYKTPIILTFANNPNQFYSYAADCLGTIVYFAKRVKTISSNN